jgi:hypothetical protein
MNKDVIYIDVDDDVTAIIGKIKKAKEKIVALVPPKRAGALQSAVNLRLLERMAKTDKKQLVLITNNQALVALAASAKIPVAKNLQSKPELAEVAAIVVDDGDDIIDGSELPVGDHADSIKVKDGTKVVAGAALAKGVRSDAIDTTDLDIDGDEFATAAVGAKTAPVKSKNRPKIPNFDSFRKRLFLGIAGAVGLVILLIWMFIIAPSATVVITASTTPQPLSSTVTLGGTAATDFKTGIVTSVAQQEVVQETVEFDATGQKDVGEKAKGTVRISKLTPTAYGVPAGTRLTGTGGAVFTTDTAVTIPASTPCFPSYCAQSVNVGVTALNSGTQYNGISGSVTGPDGISGSFQGPTTGGTTKVARVVSAEDIDRAQGELIGRSTDDQKANLTKKFINGEIIVDGSFTVERAAAVSAPAVDQEAPTGKATLTIPTTYTIQAVPKAELDKYLKASLESNIDTDNQKIYSTGIDTATLSNYKKDGETMLATVNATGSVGPKIDEDEIKQEVKGKRYGEVQQSLESIDGVQEVDVQFSHFWVRTIPNNIDKIKIEFKVQDE